MIVPIARLFGTTTDDILGMENGDARRAEFDEAMKDRSGYSEDRYALAKQAVAEFPDNMDYLFWLAEMELMKTEWKREELGKRVCHDLHESAVKHFKIVLENTANASQRISAIWRIVTVLGETLSRPEEAEEYWKMYPDEQLYTKEELKVSLLKDEKQLKQMQKVANTHFMKMLQLLNDIWMYNAQHSMDDLEHQKPVYLSMVQMYKAMFPDGNYCSYCINLQMIYTSLANYAVQEGKLDEAVEYLRLAKEICNGLVTVKNTDKTVITSGPLKGLEFGDLSVAERCAAFFKLFENNPFFIPLRDRADFKALFAE